MCGVSLRGYGNFAWWQKTVASQKHFLDASSAYCMCTFLFYLSLLCLLCFLFFFPFPHAVPKRALQRDKYGSQTKHCLSNVIDFGFTFFSLNADKGVMKKKEILIPFGSNDILSNRPVKISLNRILNSPAVCTTWCKTVSYSRRSDSPQHFMWHIDINWSVFFPASIAHPCRCTYTFLFHRLLWSS